MIRLRCADVGLWLCLVLVRGIEEDCFASECSGHVQDANFLQMQLSLDSALESEDNGIIDTIKSKLHPLATIIDKIRARKASTQTSTNESEAANGTSNYSTQTSTNESEAANGTSNYSGDLYEQIVVDRRNFSQLVSDLNYSQRELGAAQALADKFEKALLRVERAKHQVQSAQETKDAALEQIHKLLGVTIQSEKLLDENLPLEEAVRQSNPLIKPAKFAATTASKVANLTKEVRKADETIIQFGKELAEALSDQTGNVTRIQALLRTAILREMNDTSLVQILDASDRISATVTMTTTTSMAPGTVIVVVSADNWTSSKTETSTKSTTKMSTTSTPHSSTTRTTEAKTTSTTLTVDSREGRLGLYPSDWAVIGSLILLGVLVALITIYSRTVGA